jgi:NADH:ubiquinone reductase (H+-translocating)
MKRPIHRWQFLVSVLLSSPDSQSGEALVTAGLCVSKKNDRFQPSMAWSGSNNYLEQLETVSRWEEKPTFVPTPTRTESHQYPQMERHQKEVNRMDAIRQAEQDDKEMQDYLKMLSTEVDYKKLLNQNPYSLTDIDMPVIVERVLDTLEDGTQKRNGKLKGQAKLKGRKEPLENRPTVIVLGTGWAAHAFIKAASTYDLRICVVSPVNHFVFTPMLASAAVGTIEYRSMTEPIRVTNPFIDNYVEGRAVGVDVRHKVLTVQLTSLSTVTGAFKGIATNAPCRLEPEESLFEGGASKLIELNYDYLVCAVGTSVRSSIVPGAKEFCFNLKTSQDSKRLRTAIGEALENASRPTCQEAYYPGDPEQQRQATIERQRRVRFAIVGGGPTGVELAGEMRDFFSQVCSKPNGAFQHLANDIEVLLVHGGSDLLPAMDQDLRDRALVALKAQGIKVILNTRLEEVGQDFLIIKEKGSDQSETIPVGLTVWAAGNVPVPFVKDLLSQLPESAAGPAGRINIDQWLRCPTPTTETFGSILVLGDVACLEANGKYDPEKVPLPQTAQVAGQQGAFAARMLNRRYDLTQTPPRLKDLQDEPSLLRPWLLARGLETAPEFKFLNLGYLAYVGGGEALNQVKLGDVPLFNYSGKVAFALWRTVYLAKQAATRNQALIAFDWLRTELFGRDITRL